MPSFREVAARVRQGELGRSTAVETPFGRRLLCYADLTATGRAVDFVERQMEALLPYYANTHTALSTTGRVTTALREEARRQVARGVGAGPEDEVLFVGSGATAAVNKLVGLLGLRIPEPLEREFALSRAIPRERRPVVLTGPYEHHSNELPWLESIAELVEVELAADGGIDLDDLARKARAHRDRPLRLGAVSAASNVTGVITDVRAVARILHAEGALACVDCAAGGPYLPIDMHPGDPAERIDALFLSVHKFMGGPGASGVLVAHRDLFRSRVPERPGGGTVDYVSAFGRLSVDYAPRLAEREEGGTPNILGDVRAGLAFALKELLGPEEILAHELALARSAAARLSRHPRIRLLGPTEGRLPILSFNVEGLHHDLVSALLDQLFGIQNRAGCSCAGPYGHRLLGIDRERSERYRRLIQAGMLGVKPGWVRVSLPYTFTDADADFVLSAIELIADEGEAFVPLYRLGWRDGIWRPEGAAPRDPVPVPMAAAALWEARDAHPAATPPISEEALAEARAGYLAEARRLAAGARARWEREKPEWNRPTGDAEVDAQVWFRYAGADGL